MSKRAFTLIVLVVLILTGCQTTPVKRSPLSATKKEMAQAIGQVADAITGQELTAEQKKKLTKDIQGDKDTQSALNVIAGAMDINKAVVKYCPVDGKRFAPNVETCPIHNVKLEELTN